VTTEDSKGSRIFWSAEDRTARNYRAALVKNLAIEADLAHLVPNAGVHVVREPIGRVRDGP
jgi:hypothetical protein